MLLRNNLRTKSENNGCERPLSNKIDRKGCSELRPKAYEGQREKFETARTACANGLRSKRTWHKANKAVTK